MARKKTIDELRIEREKAEQDLKLRQENLKKLKAKEAELTRNARTHRLCTHGAMLEQYLSPDEFTKANLYPFCGSVSGKHFHKAINTLGTHIPESHTLQPNADSSGNCLPNSPQSSKRFHFRPSPRSLYDPAFRPADRIPRPGHPSRRR